jgi:Helix-turn-helix domain
VGDASDDYLSPADAARLLRVTPQAVRDQARRGQLPCVIRRVGTTRHRYLFPKAAIEALVPSSPTSEAKPVPSHDLSTLDLELAMTKRQVAELDKEVALLRAQNADLRRDLLRASRAIRVLTEVGLEAGNAGEL